MINLINTERNSQVQLMEREMKEMTCEEREKEGRTISGLIGKFIKKELKMAIARFSSFDIIKTEINVGDMVLISEGDPFAKNIAGTVTEKRKRKIFVAFSGRIPNWAFGNNLRMDLYVNDITFSRMEKNLRFLSERGKNALKLILNYSESGFNEKKKRPNYSDKNLNEFQKRAISSSINSKDFFLIHGPFGTGKTKTLVELTVQEVKNGNKVLVTAESNAAVDNLVERLSKNTDLNITRIGHLQKVSPDALKHTLISKVENHEIYKEKILKKRKEVDELFDKLSKKTEPNHKNRKGLTDAKILSYAEKGIATDEVPLKTIKSMAEYIRISSMIKRKLNTIKKIEPEIVKDVLDKSQVILSTNSTAASEEIEDMEFDVAIIDEASQTTIPSIMIPIAKVKRFILAGDHKQLPPTVLSQEAKELEISMFEKLIDIYPQKKQLLNIQFRMNKTLMDFPNSEFYNNELRCAEVVKDIKLNIKREKLDIESPILFIDTSQSERNYEKKLKYSKSFINILEAKLAVKISKEYLKLGVDDREIGIISPYANQVAYIKNRTDVEVKTVDGFQGREKDIIIISTVRSNKWGNIGFLKDLRRLNVAITRAKRKLIIIGNSETLMHNETYKRLIDYCMTKKAFIQLK